jgi:hypothetical protein
VRDRRTVRGAWALAKDTLLDTGILPQNFFGHRWCSQSI